jgi:short subunit dehydrogenase-like uncharacterized protein
MAEAKWLLYGATGFTGQLIAREAVKRGLQPVLAGRSAEKVEPLARELGLEWRAFPVTDHERLMQELAGFQLIYLSAGPFIETSQPVIRACLEAGCHYADITGEPLVFENTFSHDREARDRGVVLVSGAGFDVIPTDCLAKHVADQLPGAVELQTAVAAISSPSAGTAKSGVEILSSGGMVRQNGKLVPYPLGLGVTKIQFSDHQRTAIPSPWGDLSTAFRSTGIPNITCYTAVPSRTARMLKWFGGIIPTLLRIDPIRELAKQMISRSKRGPDPELMQKGTSYLWARATDANGVYAQAWMETIEPYRFTAEAAPGVVERILTRGLVGALSPAQVLGEEFPLTIQRTRRIDQLGEPGIEPL